MRVSFGDPVGLQFELDWEPVDPALGMATAAEVTRGELRLIAQGQAIWHGEDVDEGFPWTWVELLEFLIQAWPYLLWEDGLPLELSPNSPRAMATLVEDRWKRLSADGSAGEEAEFEGFEEVHNLAAGIQGAWLPPAWVVREGHRYWLCTDLVLLRLQAHDLISPLEAIGDEIARRLREMAPEEERSILALKGWGDRHSVPLTESIKIATGLDDRTINGVAQDLTLEDAWEVQREGFELNELLAAARMAAGLPPDAISEIVRHVRGASAVATPTFGRYESDVRPVLIEVAERRPFEQGQAVAQWMREVLQLDPEGRVDPAQILEQWGVVLQHVSIDAPEVDAFACWGTRHGPVIFLNESGRHNVRDGGRRASLAHEICHLLLDRNGALPLAEVLGGRTTPLVEARAGAFAAELLIPSYIAGREMARSMSPHRTLSALQTRYGVSQEVIAWQARNSEENLPPEAWTLLRSKVSQPWRF